MNSTITTPQTTKHVRVINKLAWPSQGIWCSRTTTTTTAFSCERVVLSLAALCICLPPFGRRGSRIVTTLFDRLLDRLSSPFLIILKVLCPQRRTFITVGFRGFNGFLQLVLKSLGMGLRRVSEDSDCCRRRFVLRPKSSKALLQRFTALSRRPWGQASTSLLSYNMETRRLICSLYNIYI